MRRAYPVILALTLAVSLTACTSTKQVADIGFKPPPPGFTVAVFTPDVRVGELTAGGLFERRQDWTDAARTNIVAALQAYGSARGGTAALFDPASADPALRAQLLDVQRLHRAVGSAILLHKFAGQTLPSKKDRFDWTLGSDARVVTQATSARYALFIYASDSFSSGGRQALQALGYAGCLVLVCIAVPGGEQTGFASLVELESGQVVWFNLLDSATGDVRTPEGATKMVAHLLDTFPAGARPVTAVGGAAAAAR